MAKVPTPKNNMYPFLFVSKCKSRLSTPINILIFVCTFKINCSLYHKDQKISEANYLVILIGKKVFVSFWSVFRRHTFLPTLSYNVRFCLRYLPTQKSDILYGRSLIIRPWCKYLVPFLDNSIQPVKSIQLHSSVVYV